MGIVARQSIKSSVVVYAGVFLSVVINLFIWPLCFDINEIGVLRVLLDIAAPLTVFVNFGLPNTISRFFPFFQNDKTNNNGLLKLVLKYSLLGTLAFTALFFLFEDFVKEFYAKDSPLLSQNLVYLYVFTVIMAGINIFESYSASNLRIVVPKIFKDFLFRVLVIGLTLGYFFYHFSFNTYLLAYTLLFLLVLVLILVYLQRMGKLGLGKQIIYEEPGLKKQIFKFNSVILLGGFGGLLLTKADVLLIAAAPQGDFNNGIYTTAILLASMIELPGRSVGQISLPIIADNFKIGNWKEIQKMYGQSSNIQLSIALLIFCLIWANIENIFGLMPNGDKFIQGQWAFLIIGLAQIFNMSTSLNASILAITKHYYIITLVSNIAAVLGVVLNLWLIPKFQINGAAIATGATIILLHGSIMFFAWLHYKVFPYSMATLKILGLAVVVILVVYLLPHLHYYILDGAIKTIVIIGLFTIGLLKLNVSSYFNDMYAKVLQTITAKLKRK
jgi:O-antigen/teichoic acid export membrane protein